MRKLGRNGAKKNKKFTLFTAHRAKDHAIFCLEQAEQVKNTSNLAGHFGRVFERKAIYRARYLRPFALSLALSLTLPASVLAVGFARSVIPVPPEAEASSTLGIWDLPWFRVEALVLWEKSDTFSSIL